MSLVKKQHQQLSLPVIVGCYILASTFIQAWFMGATIVQVLIAQDSAPISMANTLEWGKTISVCTT